METDAQRLFMLETAGVDVKANGYTYKGIHDSPYTNPLMTEGRDHSVILRSTDVTECALAQGDTIKVDGTNYTARTQEPDGQGMTRVILEAV